MNVELKVVPYDGYGVVVERDSPDIYLGVYQIYGVIVKAQHCQEDVDFCAKIGKEFITDAGQTHFDYVIDKRFNVFNFDDILVCSSNKTIENALRFICKDVANFFHNSNHFNGKYKTVWFEIDSDAYSLPVKSYGKN